MHTGSTEHAAQQRPNLVLTVSVFVRESVLVRKKFEKYGIDDEEATTIGIYSYSTISLLQPVHTYTII